MDMQKVLTESNIFMTSSHGIMFGQKGRCENCGAEYHEWSTPWITFDGVTTEECRAEAIWQYDMKQIKEENNLYYSEDTDSNECCDRCNE